MKKNLVTRLMACALASVLLVGTAGSTAAGAASNDELASLEVVPAGADATGNPDDSAEPEGIQPGTEFHFWTNYDVPAYCPWMDNRASALFYQIYDNLLIKYKGNNQDIRCNIAKDYSVSEDGLIWTFELRDDVTFSNGNKLTSADFIATWDVMQNYQPRPFTSVEKYEAPDDYTLVVTLKNANPTFIYELPTQSAYGVVDHTVLEEFGPEDNQSAVGCGPYVIESYTSGEGFVLKAREDYWDETRMPHIETCFIDILPDENSALMSMMTGQLDCMNTVSTEIITNLVDYDFRVALIEDRENPFWLNGRRVECLADPKVREALCHMLDWQALTDLVYDGLYPHPNSYFTGEGLTEYSDKYTYDTELGLQLLEEAGWAPEDIKFEILADPDFTDLEVAMVSQFNALGLTGITTVTYDGATCYGMLKSGEYDVFPCHNGYDPASPLTPFTMGLLEGGTQPVMFLKGVDDAAYDEAAALYDAVNSSTTLEDYYDNFHKLADYVQEQNLALGGLQVMRGYAFSEKIRGAYVAPVTSELQFVHLWIAE